MQNLQWRWWPPPSLRLYAVLKLLRCRLASGQRLFGFCLVGYTASGFASAALVCASRSGCLWRPAATRCALDVQYALLTHCWGVPVSALQLLSFQPHACMCYVVFSLFGTPPLMLLFRVAAIRLSSGNLYVSAKLGRCIAGHSFPCSVFPPYGFRAPLRGRKTYPPFPSIPL